MGIKVEFNPDLALRNIRDYKSGNRKIEECIPENLEKDGVYEFLKSGQRFFWLNDDPNWGNGQMPLCETDGDENLSRPIASIKMIEVTHFLENGIIYTKGKYKVIDVFDINNKQIHFEACKRI